MTIAPVRDLEPLTWPKDVIFPPGDLDSDEPELETYQHLGQHENKLRFFTPEGQLVPTPMEAAWQASQQAEAEQQRADRLAAQLRSLGVEPE